MCGGVLTFCLAVVVYGVGVGRGLGADCERSGHEEYFPNSCEVSWNANK